MIRKTNNDVTIIELGEGTVFTGNVRADEQEKPFGIVFTNEKGVPNLKGSVVIQMTSNKAVASYMMALMRFLEEFDDDKESQFSQTVKTIMMDLEKLQGFSNK